MKKYIFAAVLAFGILASPAPSYATGLTNAQIQSILTILSAFGADATTIANVSAALNGNPNPEPVKISPPIVVEPKVSLFMSLATSTSGPWAVNGSLPNSGTIYIQTSGLIKANAPKGCMSPTASAGCLNASAYRDFTPSEWVNNSMVRTVVYGGQFPNGSYDGYILYSYGKPTKIGTVNLTAPATDTPVYKWVCSSFGGSVQPPSYACTIGNVNSSVNVSGGTCYCTATSGTTTTPPAPAQDLKVSLSNSTSGSWAVNGSLPNSGTIYIQTSGLIKANAPKGCMTPAGSTVCLSASAYRDFATAEWVNGTTVRTLVTGGQFPNGSYDGYILYPNGQPTKVGTVTLTAAVTPGSNPGSSGSGGAVFGAGSSGVPGSQPLTYTWYAYAGSMLLVQTPENLGWPTPSVPCTQGNVGATYYLGMGQDKVTPVVAQCIASNQGLTDFVKLTPYTLNH